MTTTAKLSALPGVAGAARLLRPGGATKNVQRSFNARAEARVSATAASRRVAMLLLALPLSAQARPPPSVQENLSAQRIFFAHQSVGQNVLDGLADLTQGRLRVVEGGAAELERPGLVHARVGHNGDPSGKVAHFEALMDAVGPQVDVALFKLCYVDFDADTDVPALFERYCAAHARLTAKFPHVAFVHVTAPLTTVQGGFKGWLRGAVGADVWGEAENAKRAQFNALLRSTFAGEPIFDLAQLEATRPDGAAHTFERQGARVPALAPEYSDDGGHLNALGRRLAAEALLRLLAALPPKAPPR